MVGFSKGLVRLRCRSMSKCRGLVRLGCRSMSRLSGGV